MGGHRLLGYRETFDFGAIGRNISRPEGLSNISPVTLEYMEQNDSDRAADYSAWKKHLSGAPFPAPGNKYFWKSDIMVQHGTGYYLSAKVISTRTNGTEMLNNENLKGYNLPLGATNILTSGKEYEGIFLYGTGIKYRGLRLFNIRTLLVLKDICSEKIGLEVG